MEYSILNELTEYNNKRKQEFMEKNNVYFISQIVELTNPFNGSVDNIHCFLFQNYIKGNELCNLIIVIRDNNKGIKNHQVGVSNIETAIYPMPVVKQDIKLDKFTAPQLHPEVEKFIIEKRSLPKKKNDKSRPRDLNKDRWTFIEIAKALHMSNRTIAQYCKAKNI